MLTRSSRRLNEVTHELTALQKKLAEKSCFDQEHGSNGTLEGSIRYSEISDVTKDDVFYLMTSSGDLPTSAPRLAAIELETGQVAALFEQ